MIYRRGESPPGTRFAVYQCPKCGFDTEIAYFLARAEVNCSCKNQMRKVAIGKQINNHLQLLLDFEEFSKEDNQ